MAVTGSIRPSSLSIVLIDDQLPDWRVAQLRRRHIEVRSGATLHEAQELLATPCVVAFIDAYIPAGPRDARPDARWGLRALEIAREARPSACRVLATGYPSATLESEARVRGAEFERKPLEDSTILRYLFRGIGSHHGLPDEETSVLVNLATQRRMPPTAMQLGVLAALDFRASDARKHFNMTPSTFKDHVKTLLNCVGVDDFRAVGELIRARARELRRHQGRTLPRG